MRRLVALAFVLFVLVTAAPAHAAFTLTLQSGSLTFPTTVLTGDVVVTTGNAAPTFHVNAGTNSGWNVTLQIGNFTSGGNTIAASNLSYTAVNGTLVQTKGQQIDSVNGPIETGFSGTLDVARKCVDAQAGFGNGQYNWLPDSTKFVLSVPATTLVGSYSATLTATLVSGP